MEILSIACDRLRVEQPVPCRYDEMGGKASVLLEMAKNSLLTTLPVVLRSIALLTVLATMRGGKLTKTVIVGRTIEKVRQEAIRRGVVRQLSKSTVQLILSQGDLRPHKIRGWMHSPDPQFRQKVTEICDLYHLAVERTTPRSRAILESLQAAAYEACPPALDGSA